jgi:hypothetical protein
MELLRALGHELYVITFDASTALDKLRLADLYFKTIKVRFLSFQWPSENKNFLGDFKTFIQSHNISSIDVLSIYWSYTSGFTKSVTAAKLIPLAFPNPRSIRIATFLEDRKLVLTDLYSELLNKKNERKAKIKRNKEGNIVSMSAAAKEKFNKLVEAIEDEMVKISHFIIVQKLDYRDAIINRFTSRFKKNVAFKSGTDLGDEEQEDMRRRFSVANNITEYLTRIFYTVPLIHTSISLGLEASIKESIDRKSNGFDTRKNVVFVGDGNIRSNFEVNNSLYSVY